MDPRTGIAIGKMVALKADIRTNTDIAIMKDPHKDITRRLNRMTDLDETITELMRLSKELSYYKKEIDEFYGV